ncbi:helix-turn-helix transcriptional regulator [Saccharopolyspora elongata]|uniref:Helix-turn-helix transcriptional regulator n=1 Tax=Saccharopolyspora elongata TaxID=2530387 RepID=A0A4R4ZA11_9PSEU|nr:LuxR family transcriptional regulator [Saccharopolyspora elongata]TDD55083.1 helix-turn-helix transcriptional regulator [Saccharopolyspora elongata]
MGREQMAIEGRDDALAALRSALRTSAPGGRLLIVRGDVGIGKTRLLDAAGRRWRARGTRVAQVRGRSRATAAEAGTDRYGVGAVVDALRQDFDRFGDCGLVDAISALTRFRQAEEPAARFPAVAAELNWVFGRISSRGPVAVLVDDAPAIADPVPLLQAARRPGCLVVASIRPDEAVAAELLDLADEVIDLDPLADEHIAALAGDDLDESVHVALRAALGPLYGNPGTVLATVEALRDRGRLVADGDHLRLDDQASICLPYDHDLLLRARRLGGLGPRLLATTAWLGAFGIDDLPAVADALGEDVAECGRTVDRLVENGLLVGDVRGRLCCLCPALAVSAVAEERAAVRCLAGPAAEFPKPALLRETGGSPLAAAPAQPPSAAQSWSATESRIVELIGMGLTNRRIGSALGLSEKTVESQLTRLFAKTGCRSRVALVAAANSAGSLRGAALRGRSAA